MEYELLYLVGENKEADLDRIKKEVEEIVTKEGGNFSQEEVIEKRKMAYKIDHQIRGTYVAKRFSYLSRDEREKSGIEEKDIISKITNKLNLYPDVLRFIMVNTDELPELKEREEQIKKAQEKAEGKEGRREERKEITSEKRKESAVKFKKAKEAKISAQDSQKEKKEETKAVEKSEETEKDEEAEKGKKKAEKTEEPEKKKEGKEKKNEVDQEDIDKKLEEILNI